MGVAAAGEALEEAVAVLAAGCPGRRRRRAARARRSPIRTVRAPWRAAFSSRLSIAPRRPLASPSTTSSSTSRECEVHVGVAAACVGEGGVGDVRRRRPARGRAAPASPRASACRLSSSAVSRATSRSMSATAAGSGSAARLARRLVSGVRSSWPASAVKRSVAATEVSSRASMAFSDSPTSWTSAGPVVSTRTVRSRVLLTRAALSRRRPSGRSARAVSRRTASAVASRPSAAARAIVRWRSEIRASTSASGAAITSRPPMRGRRVRLSTRQGWPFALRTVLSPLPAGSGTPAARPSS